MKKTNEEVLEFLQAAQTWERGNPLDSKLRYAVGKMKKKAEKVRKRVQGKIERIEVENAMTSDKEGEKGKLLRNDRGQFEYNKEGMLKRIDMIDELMQQEVEIEPHIATEIPDDLKPEHRDQFLGFVIEEGKNGTAQST